VANEDLCYTSATELARLIREKDLSPVEVMEGFLDRIEEVNPAVNAWCTVASEKARQEARGAEAKVASGASLGPLHGVPVAVKDLTPTAGIRTTWGSRIFENHIPDEDALVVERLRAAGAIVIGKTNTPEFGAGANTYNAVFGATRNPWGPTHTCGGSSGGSAVALACGMTPLATGTDLGGSLRIPAAFCGVVGFRTSPGLVPIHPGVLGWDAYSVEGPMARTVEDTALMLSVTAGFDPRAPLSFPVDRESFLTSVKNPAVRGWRVAWAGDLGIVPVDREVMEIAGAAARRFADLGCVVEEARPDFSGAREVVQVSRAGRMAALHAAKLEKWRDQMNPNLVWNIEKGGSLTARELGEAEKGRTAIYHRVRRFLENYTLVLTPTVAVPPFPVEQSYPKEINGETMTTYTDWILLTYAFSITGLPAISIPCGWTASGFPVGLQIVGRHRAETDVLRAAAAFEAAAPWKTRRP
jgi:amidase